MQQSYGSGIFGTPREGACASEATEMGTPPPSEVEEDEPMPMLKCKRCGSRLKLGDVLALAHHDKICSPAQLS